MFFWHLGASVAVVRAIFRDPRMDLRVLMIGAVLANFIDTPIGLVFWDQFRNARLFAHSLLSASVLMVVVLLLTRRGRPRKLWMPLAIGALMHLVLDAMWRQQETLWWPFLGWQFTQTTYDSAGDYVAAILTDWRMWVLELAGLIYLVLLARRARLNQREPRVHFLTTGRIDTPLQRPPPQS